MAFQRILEVEVPVTRRAVLRHLGCPSGVSRAASRLVEGLPATWQGRASLRELAVDEVSDPWLKTRTQPAHGITVGVACVEVPESRDALQRHLLHAVGCAAALGLLGRIAAHLRARHAPSDLSPRWSPGLSGWDLEAGQRLVFAHVDAAALGVRLRPGGFMTPVHTVSFAFGIGRFAGEDRGSCRRCRDRRCPARDTGGAA